VHKPHKLDNFFHNFGNCEEFYHILQFLAEQNRSYPYTFPDHCPVYRLEISALFVGKMRKMRKNAEKMKILSRMESG
jgi:hypothetical protein